VKPSTAYSVDVRGAAKPHPKYVRINVCRVCCQMYIHAHERTVGAFRGPPRALEEAKHAIPRYTT
jgi:hypothetical protein